MIFRTLLALCLALSSVQGDKSVSQQDQLYAFRLAIALTEGAGKVNYEQINDTTMALGAYQFLQKYWDWYATEAGYAGADWRDPDVQDAVAEWHMNKNYNDLGSWELAAIAHFGGRTRAFQAKENGIESVGTIKDSEGTDIQTYVNKVMQHYEEILRTGKSFPEANPPPPDMLLPSDNEYINPLEEPAPVTKEAATLLDVLSQGVSDNGRKKFPMTNANAGGERPSVGLDFEQQAPPQVVDQVSQYTQTIEKAYQEYLDSVKIQ